MKRARCSRAGRAGGAAGGAGRGAAAAARLLRDEDVPRILALRPVAAAAAARRRRNRVSGQPAPSRFGAALFFDAGAVGQRHAVPAPAATSRRAASATACRAAVGLRRGDRNTPALPTWACSAGSAGTAPTTTCGRRACARCSMRARWARSLARVARSVRDDAELRLPLPRAPSAATPGDDDERVARRCRPRRWPPSQETLRLGAHALRRLPRRAWRAATARPRRAIRSPRSAAWRCSSAAARCYVCHAGPASATASSPTSAMPFFIAPRRRSTPAATAASSALQRQPLQPARPLQRRRRGAAAPLSTAHVRARAPQLRRVQGAQPARPGAHRALHARRQLRHAARRAAPLLRTEQDRLHADGEQMLVPLRLAPHETDDLLAFLHSLRAAGRRGTRRDPGFSAAPRPASP